MKQDLKNNPNIVLGDVDVPEGFDDPKNAKLRITSWIDGDIYLELKKRAEAGEGNGKYQTLMNDLLREMLFGKEAEKESEKISISTKDLCSFLKSRKFETQVSRIVQKIEARRPVIASQKKPGSKKKSASR